MNFQMPFPKAFAPLAIKGTYKNQFDHFIVDEETDFVPTGEGEHLYVKVKKVNTNTQWLARRLANHAQIKLMDVGYAGLKDRHGVTTQWFSLYLGNRPDPDLTHVNNDEIEILETVRHNRKLRKGELVGNRFKLVVQLDTADDSQWLALEERLALIAKQGYPNYFGEQRFGFDRGNLDKAIALFAGELKERNKQKRGLYISAARSFIFNQVLAKRIELGNWFEKIPGDVESFDMPTGPMWGRGRLDSGDEVLAIEQDIADQNSEFCYGLEHIGLKQERRPLVVKPSELSWQRLDAQQMEICFGLGAGYYATSLLQEIGQFEDASRDRSDQSDLRDEKE